ncbi:hypothetical protein [Sphingopyxis sp. 550A]
MAVPSTWPRDIAAAGGAYWPLTLFNDEPLTISFTIKDVDYSGAAFEGNIRAAFEESSAVLKAFDFSASPVGADTLVIATLAESDVLALRSGVDPGAIETLFYSIKVTPSGGSKQTFFAGDFKVMGA